MRKSLPQPACYLRRCYSTTLTPPPPLIKISKATFYREFPTAKHAGEASKDTNPPIFPKFSFKLPSDKTKPQLWAIIGPTASGKTTLLRALQGQLLCDPPLARKYPYLSSDEFIKSRTGKTGAAIAYVGFDGQRDGLGGGGTQGSYLSARFESRTEATDFTLDAYLRGNTELNPFENEDYSVERLSREKELGKVVEDLKLKDLLDMPARNLSNGQTRRARIAKAILARPELLLLDEPYMGLDPPTQAFLTELIHGLALKSAPRIILALGAQDPVPDWVTHTITLKGKDANKFQVKGRTFSNGRPKIRFGEPDISDEREPLTNLERLRLRTGEDEANFALRDMRRRQSKSMRECFVEMNGVEVKYGSRTIIGDWKLTNSRYGHDKGLWWKVLTGERWAIFGPNGSGKSTLLSLICSDHPQAYSLPIKIFGKSRLPSLGEPGISIFDIQANIGQTSPEIHACFPRNFSLRRSLESTWADTFFGRPVLTSHRDALVESALRHFQRELWPESATHPRIFKVGTLRPIYEADAADWADEVQFGQLPFGAQRLMLFLRAFIKSPKLLVLDEAFSGMDAQVRDKCMKMLRIGAMGWMHGDPRMHHIDRSQALICVSHVREELPPSIRWWMRLPEPGSGRPVRVGRVDPHGKNLRDDPEAWSKIWNEP